jgi:hypothetical protein
MREVSAFLRVHRSKSLTGHTINLMKLSDFLSFIDFDELKRQNQIEATDLFQRAADHERLQLTVTLRNIRDSYEMGLPRVMFVVRRAMQVKHGGRTKRGDDDLMQPSNSINWFRSNANNKHPFYPILGHQQLIDFYRVARNVASHHVGLKWEPKTHQVILEDREATLLVHIREFQQRYRYVVYLCDYGLRAILSAFCERERGAASDDILDEYNKTFPENFPFDEEVKLKYYTR